MRLPSSAQTSRPWRIHELTRDFRLEDVWELPTPGGAGDFPRLVRAIASGDPSQGSSFVVRTLFAIRWKIGGLLGWDDADSGVGSRVPTLRDRLPADLRDAAPGPDFDALPFAPLYLLDDEFAAEIANHTMHGVMHLGWVPDGRGGYRGQMAVYVKPNGRLGSAYMAAIKPFRHLIVYPLMLRQIEQTWRAESPIGSSGVSSDLERGSRSHDLTEPLDMRNVVLLHFLSLDGVAEEPSDWFFDDGPELFALIGRVIEPQDDVLLGRGTYDYWVGYWPTSDVEPFASFINPTRKHVASSTELAGHWDNAVRITAPVADYVRELKQKPGGDIGIHGSTVLARSLISARLVDELRFVIPPTVAGHGKRLFSADSADDLQQFELVDVERTPKGTLFVHYRLPAAS